jgi:hypothetical protein
MVAGAHRREKDKVMGAMVSRLGQLCEADLAQALNQILTG